MALACTGVRFESGKWSANDSKHTAYQHTTRRSYDFPEQR